MLERLRGHLTDLRLYVRRFGPDLSDSPDPDAEDEDWAFKSANELKIPLDVRGAKGRASANAAQGERRHETIVATAALLGVGTPETRDWIVTRMLASSDPTMHALARGLKRMWEADKEGRRGAAERNLQVACLLHAEVLALRTAGVGEHDIRGRAADVIRDRFRAANPGKTLVSRKRLLEVYRDNEARVLEVWPEMETLGLTGS